MSINDGAADRFAVGMRAGGSPSRPQCMSDARAIFRAHKCSILLGGVAFLAGSLLCLLLTPEARVLRSVAAAPVDVASWAASSTSYGIDLAADVCPKNDRASCGVEPREKRTKRSPLNHTSI